MIKKVSIFTFATGLTLLMNSAYALENVKSAHDVKTTADRLETVLKNKGMTIFARVDHAAGAKKVDKELLPTELVIFGNPKVGTLLMQCEQKMGLDLPLKALIWQDESGQTWYSYDNPESMKAKHDVKGCDPVFEKVKDAMANFAKAATSEK